MAGAAVPTCVWRASPALVEALDARFGEPLDTYVNGSQVWMRDDGPGGAVLQWRLHPVPGYRRPDGVSTEEVFVTVALALATGADSPAPLDALWDGLEAFPADDGAAVAPLDLAAAAVASLGLEPDAVGLVDHDRIGDAWERSGGGVSVTTALLDQLAGDP